MKAVIPAAGLGTRFLPLTKAQPKEMLPIVNKTTIQWVVEEAVNAGIKEIAIITGSHKKAIENHFSVMADLDIALESKGKLKELEEIRKVNAIADITFIIQDEQKGLGHAILCAEEFVGGDPCAVLLGDTICAGDPNCTKGLIEIYNSKGKSVLAVEEIKLEDTKRYGVVSGTSIGPGLMRIENMVEKPNPRDAPSTLGALGRYVFTPDLFEYQKTTKPGVGGEIQLSDAMRSLAQFDELYSWTFTGNRYDIGTMEDWFKSHIELSSKSEFSEILNKVIERL